MRKFPVGGYWIAPGRKDPSPPPVFLAKSAESLEKKRVEFCVNAKKCKRVRKSMKTKDGGGVGERRARSWEGPPPPPVFFGSAHSKGVTGGRLVSAHSKRLKVAVFSAIWKWLVS